MPDRTRHRIKMKICGGGRASQVDQGRHSRFTARVLLRPALCLTTELYLIYLEIVLSTTRGNFVLDQSALLFTFLP